MVDNEFIPLVTRTTECLSMTWRINIDEACSCNKLFISPKVLWCKTNWYLKLYTGMQELDFLSLYVRREQGTESPNTRESFAFGGINIGGMFTETKSPFLPRRVQEKNVFEDSRETLYPQRNQNNESVAFKMGVKDTNGKKQSASSYLRVQEKNVVGGCLLISLEELRKMHLPCAKLTVFCDLTISYGNSVPLCDVSTNTEFTGTDALARDLEFLSKHSDTSDLTFLVGEEKFVAHKLILRARSTVFAAMFAHDMEENREESVTISDISPANFKELLHYIYSGKVHDLNIDNATGMYVAADKYDLKELNNHCAHFLMTNLSMNTFQEIAVLAHMHNDGLILDAVKEFAVQNSSCLLATKQWQELVQSHTSLASEILLFVSQHFTK